MAPKAKPKPAAAAAAAAAPAVSVEDLFSTLHRHVQSSKYDQIVRVADQVLAIAPGDEDALRCKVVALVRDDKLDRALEVIKASDALPIDLSFYKAYCLYRLNKLNEALQCLEGKEKNPMILQLEAQIFYRLEKMDACLDCYVKLQKFKIESLEVKANIVATLIAAGKANDVQKMMDTLRVKVTSSFEMAYNSACSLIERGKYEDAEQQLLAARRIGQETLMEDDYAEDEIENELAPISVQLAYVHQLLGQTREAMEAYSNLIKQNLPDSLSLAVASSNLVALKGTKDVSDGLRKLDPIIERTSVLRQSRPANLPDLKLTTKQKEAIYSNCLLLLLHANKLDQAQEFVASLLTMFPGSVYPVLLQAAVFMREKKVQKAEDFLGLFAENHADKSKMVLLARAQIAAAAGHFQIAAESLNKIGEIQNMPATVATIVALRERTGDVSSASAVLDSAVEWWKNSMSENYDKLDVIMHEAASFKLNHGNQEGAAQLYEELLKSHGSTEALVGLVKTVATVDIEKAESYEKHLPPLPGLKGINVDALEMTSGAKPAEGGLLAKMEIVEEVKEKTKTKRKRKKPRYPKGFDPANPGPPPDPERWLPRKERSSYRPRRKDKRGQIRGSQGAVMREKHEATANASSISDSAQNPKSVHSGHDSSKTGAKGQSKPSSSKSRKKSRS